MWNKGLKLEETLHSFHRNSKSKVKLCLQIFLPSCIWFRLHQPFQWCQHCSKQSQPRPPDLFSDQRINWTRLYQVNIDDIDHWSKLNPYKPCWYHKLEFIVLTHDLVTITRQTLHLVLTDVDNPPASVGQSGLQMQPHVLPLDSLHADDSQPRGQGHEYISVVDGSPCEL